jgi:hypothetical protein
MSHPPYRALQIVLRVFSVLLAVGGLFMVFASKPLIMRVFLRPPESEVSAAFRPQGDGRICAHADSHALLRLP